ncbi:MAG: hypothetical protein FJ161_04900, partial [Gammaproteobacteria bacterium]|nr:hypothetical protein [Gammaproteobacteria bacterium]
MVKNSLGFFYPFFEMFGRLLGWIYPVPKEDRERVFVLFLLFFSVAFVYNTLMPLKKSIILYTPGAGAEAITYLKPFAVTPGSILLTWYFLFLNRSTNRDNVFWIMLLTFVGYFALYTFVLSPYREFFALHSLADLLSNALPASFQAAPSLLRYWMHTIFYALVELWSTTVLFVLLWGLVNEISSKEQAKSTYALFTVGANLSSVFSGLVISYISKLPYNPNGLYGSSPWDQSFFRIMLVVIAVSVLILSLYAYLVYKGHTAVFYKPDAQHKPTKFEKKSISILDCFIEVFRSKNLLYLTMIVMGYNLVYNLSDVAFNKRVQLSFANDVVGANAFLSYIQMYVGVISTFFALVVTNLSLRYNGWTATALFTPVIYLATGVFFYMAQIPGLEHWMPAFDMFALYAGAAHL